jgi:hypothetical protein
MKRLAVLSVLLLAACGGSDEATDAPAETVATTTAATTTPATSTTTTVPASTTIRATTTTEATTTTTTVPPTTQPPIDHGAQYLTIVAPFNATWATLSEEPDDAKACEVGAVAMETLAVAMNDAEWPIDLQPTVDAFVSSLLVEMAALQACNLDAAYADASAVSSGLSREIRLALGLPLDPTG